MTYADLTNHPELLDRLLQRARCERAQMMHRLFVLPVKRLFGARPRAHQRTACTAAAH